MGVDKESSTSPLSAWTNINRPTLQAGQRRAIGSSAGESRLVGESALLSTAVCRAGSNDRHNASFTFRLRFGKETEVADVNKTRGKHVE